MGAAMTTRKAPAAVRRKVSPEAKARKSASEAAAKKAAVERIINAVAGGSTATDAAKAEGITYFAAAMRISRDETLAAAYLEAKHARAVVMADEIVALADEAPQYTERGVDPGWVQWQRNRIETRKWVCAKLFPAEYGNTTEAVASTNGVKVTISIGMDIPPQAAQDGVGDEGVF